MARTKQRQITQSGSDGQVVTGELAKTLPVKTTYRKVALIGSADSSLWLAPIGDPEWEVWGLAWSHDHGVYQCARYFDPHQLEWMKGRHDGYVEYLNKLPVPIYMLHQYPEVTNSIALPRVEMMELFQGYRNLPEGGYLSTIAYMVALAIYEKVDEIGLWGIDLLTEGEYAMERPNVEYMLGVADGRGIKITIPEQSALLKAAHTYGIDLVVNHETGITSQYMKERRLRYEREKDAALAKAQTYDGGCQVINKLLDSEEPVTTEVLQGLLVDYEKERKEALAAGQTFDGAYQEADALMTQLVHWERGGVVAGNNPNQPSPITKSAQGEQGKL